MVISGILPIFLVGCFGGLIGELARWYQVKDSTDFPNYARNLLYWIITVLMILAGGGLALLYGVDSKSAILIANIGLSAPLIIKALAGVIPVPNQAPPPRLPAVRITTPVFPNSVINFLAGR